jgi:phosphohistidine phosphatase
MRSKWANNWITKKITPDVILASSAVRARQTAEILMDELKYRRDFYGLKSLYMAEATTYAQEIQKLSDDLNVALVIGHNPSLDCVLQMVTGKVESLRTTAVAYLTVPIDLWKDFRLEPQGELVNLWRPKN